MITFSNQILFKDIRLVNLLRTLSLPRSYAPKEGQWRTFDNSSSALYLAHHIKGIVVFELAVGTLLVLEGSGRRLSVPSGHFPCPTIQRLHVILDGSVCFVVVQSFDFGIGNCEQNLILLFPVHVGMTVVPFYIGYLPSFFRRTFRSTCRGN